MTRLAGLAQQLRGALAAQQGSAGKWERARGAPGIARTGAAGVAVGPAGRHEAPAASTSTACPVCPAACLPVACNEARVSSHVLRHAPPPAAALGAAAGAATSALHAQRAAYSSDIAIRGIDALKSGPGGRSSVSGITATIFGCSGFLGRYVANAIGNTGGQLVLPHRCDDTDVQHLRTMGDLGQVVMMPDFRWGAGSGGKGGGPGAAGVTTRAGSTRSPRASRPTTPARCPPALPPGRPPRSIRDEEAVRRAISRSNLVVNMLGAGQETWNYGFEEVHIEWPARLARAIRDSGKVERFIHLRCGAGRRLGAPGSGGLFGRRAGRLAGARPLSRRPAGAELPVPPPPPRLPLPLAAAHPPAAPRRAAPCRPLQRAGRGGGRPLPPPAHQGCRRRGRALRAGPHLHHLQARGGQRHRGPPVQHVCHHGQAHALPASHRWRQDAHAAGVGARRGGRWGRRRARAGLRRGRCGHGPVQGIAWPSPPPSVATRRSSTSFTCLPACPLPAAIMNSLKTYDSLGQTYYLAGPDVMTVAQLVRARPARPGPQLAGLAGWLAADLLAPRHGRRTPWQRLPPCG